VIPKVSIANSEWPFHRSATTTAIVTGNRTREKRVFRKNRGSAELASRISPSVQYEKSRFIRKLIQTLASVGIDVESRAGWFLSSFMVARLCIRPAEFPLATPSVAVAPVLCTALPGSAAVPLVFILG
jgi:hypothetical protein